MKLLHSSALAQFDDDLINVATRTPGCAEYLTLLNRRREDQRAVLSSQQIIQIEKAYLYWLGKILKLYWLGSNDQVCK